MSTTVDSGHLRRGALLALAFHAAPASADQTDKVPVLSVATRDTFDTFTVPAGIDPGIVALNKLQLSATLRGEALGLKGWQGMERAHAGLSVRRTVALETARRRPDCR